MAEKQHRRLICRESTTSRRLFRLVGRVWFIVLTPFVVGCNNNGSTEQISAGSGQIVSEQSAHDIRRIVSTMPNTTEILDALGVFDRVVGVSMFCDVPPEATQLPGVGSGLEPDVERILSLRPDLVIGSVVQRDLPFLSVIEDVDVDVFLIRDQTLEDLYESMIDLGVFLGVEQQAIDVTNEMRQSLAELAALTEGLPPVRLLFVADHDPIFAAGPTSFFGPLFATAGAENVVEQGSWVQLDFEQVVQLAPEAILESTTTPGGLSAWGELVSVPAVREQRIYTIESHAIARPGPAVPDAVWEIAERLHPNRIRR